MTDLLLYTLAIPGDSQSGLPNRLQQQLATSGLLDQDGGVVEQLSSEPGDQTISGYFRAQYADLMANELEELGQASGFADLPLGGMGESTSADGYYSLESADVEQVAPQTPLLQRYDMTLRHRGTQKDQWRALDPSPTQLDRESWGNATTRYVGVPAAASKVQWYNSGGDSRQLASPLETRSAELGGVDIYDLDVGETAVGATEPTLIYEIPYTAEEDVDCRVWDTRGTSAKLDANGDVQWQKVFSTQHDFSSEIVIDNGRFRLRLDEPNGTLEAETWDDTAGSWSTVGLESSQPASTTLFDVDFEAIAMARAQAQLTFDVDGSLFALEVSLSRGLDGIQAGIPEGESGPIPTDLETWLSPIVLDSIVDTNASKTLVARREVRR